MAHLPKRTERKSATMKTRPTSSRAAGNKGFRNVKQKSSSRKK